MNNKLFVTVLLAIGILTHFVFFGHPKEVVFDEVHFGGFISNYYKGEYFFDIHPPLGKIMIAGFAKIFDFTPEISFAEIGNKFPNNQYMALRFLPNVAGAILPLIIFLLLLELGLERKAAFFGGLFVALENAILTQTLYILLDGFLLVFGFLSLLFYFKYKNTDRFRYLLWAAVFSGLTISIKWTGAAFVGLPVVIELLRWLQNKKQIVKLLRNYAILAIIPFAIYAAVWWVHFDLLQKSGPGDAFMGPRFQSTLIGNPSYDPEAKMNFWAKLSEVNIQAYFANQGLKAEHGYSSKWHTWPLMKRPIYYWVNNNARIYLIGNPIIWWASTVAIVYLAVSLLFGHVNWRDKNYLPLIIVSGYILNLLPFIGVDRVMFLYHYFVALIFAIIALVYIISQHPHNKKIFWGLLSAAAIAFLYFAPLNYGLELPPDSYKNRVWVESWE